tara:strand:+ start:89 stop:319 length:231 start_codon:yes stop_codon:yes gene_type:complete
MKDITQHTGTITDIQRLPSSYMGNPRYSFMIDGREIVTGVDSMHGYVIGNYENKRITVTVGMHYNKLTLNSTEVAA